AHHVDALLTAPRVVLRARLRRAACRDPLGLTDEAVHLPAVDVGYRVVRRVRTAVVAVVAVVIRPLAVSLRGIGDTDRRCAVRVAGDAAGSGIGSEVTVER